MKLALTLLVRDEEDVVEAHLAYHLAAGVDVVIATDHRSADGTKEILESYARDGRVHLIRREDERIDQPGWVTRMARLAATEHAADWVIHSDADEFWWPREGSLKEVLAAVPDPYGVVHAVSRSFVPRPGEDAWPERMTTRLALAAPVNDPATPFRHVAKVAHRAHAGAVVHQGNHRVSGVPFETVRGWSPLEVLHFPLRSAAQSAGKHERTLAAWRVNLRGDLSRARTTLAAGRPDAFYERVALDDETVRRGLRAGTLVEDTRLRDALRALRDGGGPLRFDRPAFADDAARALESVLLAEADGVRLQRRADELASRLDGGSGDAVYGSARR